jgi:hypothetical protein
LAERRTAGEQQLTGNRSSNCGCEERQLQVVTPCSFLSTHLHYKDSEKSKHLLSESRTVRRIDVRWICQAKQKVAFNDFQRTSLDSHADTCCTGSNMAVLELTGEKVNVFPFSENLPAVQEVPIAMVLTVWESPSTGKLWMLVIHEALYFGE